MTRTLDKTRPYGQIFGTLENGAVFEQDGFQFNNQGEMVAAPGPKSEPDEVPPAVVKPKQEEPDLRKKLNALHAKAVRKLVEDEGMTPAEGPGSKARNIEMLLGSG